MFAIKIGSMKYMKRSGIYKASNVTFDPVNMQAHSYNWWLFVSKIKGKVVFNNYSYSPTTNGHQSKVRKVMSDLGIKIDHFVEAPKGLQALGVAIDSYNYKINTLVTEIQKPRSHKVKNEQRAALIKEYQAKIKLLNELSK